MELTQEQVNKLINAFNEIANIIKKYVDKNKRSFY